MRGILGAAVAVLLAGAGSAAAQVGPLVCESASNDAFGRVAVREGPFRQMRGVLRYTGIVEGQPKVGFLLSDGKGREIVFALNNGSPPIGGQITTSVLFFTRIREFREGKLTGESGTGLASGSEFEFELASGTDGKTVLSIRERGTRDYDTVTLVTPAMRQGVLALSCSGGRFELVDLTIE
ncbi:hypothetical protein P1X14_19300 [Sphingomonas sp. AOB5]|uniref:hypothetical protein n=1 Tax=Sphingomonas sp. AOB5 TaxID=3034017 RepID=UPI0023F9FBED|nr:hypothetical protein [Sphingomonas sp. AOB5]MDF7777412.1 hypothetical protein [Sphingomonas sp. AOB5]